MPRVIRDIVYGHAGVAHSTAPRQIPLRMDAYLPDAPSGPVPAVVLAFGGAFLRGSKEDDCFPTAGRFGPNTAIAEYCRRFAAEGFACFSVGYRLAGDDPDPGNTPVLTRPDDVPIGRIQEVRKIMGLPPVTAREMSGSMEAAIDDMTAAARAVIARAGEFGVDPGRVVLGGWSAGARCALYAAYAERVPCLGVLALSGLIQPEDIEAHVTPGAALPPMQVVMAEADVASMLDFAPRVVAAMRERGCTIRLARIPGRDHWYAAEAMTDSGGTVQQVMRAALRDWTGQ
jgi:dienelactone hydrolase